MAPQATSTPLSFYPSVDERLDVVLDDMGAAPDHSGNLADAKRSPACHRLKYPDAVFREEPCQVGCLLEDHVVTLLLALGGGNEACS